MSETLYKLREEINEIDAEIIRLLSKRFKLMPQIASEKKKIGAEICDNKREEEVLEKRYTLFKENGLDDKEFSDNLFKTIMKKSKDIQKDN